MNILYDPLEIVSSHCDAIILGPGYESMMVSVYTANVFPIKSAGNPCVAKCSL